MTESQGYTDPAPRSVPVVSVVGDAQLPDPGDRAMVMALGQALIDAGFRIVTGGMGGTMEAVCEGGRKSAKWQEGRILGLLPSYRKEEANPFCDIVIPTGLQLGRNVLVVAAGDVVLAVGGGAGTLSELALAWQLGKPIVAWAGRGWAGRLGGQCLDGRTDQAIQVADSLEAAIALCVSAVASRAATGDIGSGWRGPKLSQNAAASGDIR